MRMACARDLKRAEGTGRASVSLAAGPERAGELVEVLVDVSIST